MADKQSGPSISGNWIVWAGIVAIGTTLLNYVQSPIEVSRPTVENTTSGEAEHVQDVDARLWQDPFGAMWGDIRSKPEGLPIVDCKNAGSYSPHSCTPNVSDAQTLVLGVMVPGGPYPESEETRRQFRYAVLSGLKTQGFIPKDEEHIGYFRHAFTPAHSDPIIPNTVQDWGRHWIDLPFENFIRTDVRYPNILVLWIDESELLQATDDHALEGLRNLRCAFQSEAKVNLDLAVIGPWSSSTLNAMVNELNKFSLKPCDPFDAAPTVEQRTTPLLIYNSAATEEERTLIPPPQRDKITISAYFKAHNINYQRAVATDDEVACAMADELTKRGIRPADDHMLLISEWDSYYGRELPITMENAFTKKKCVGDHVNPSSITDHFTIVENYMRGLDGQLPGSPDVNTGRAARNDGRKSDPAKQNYSDESDTGSSKDIELSFGNHQYDYLRRMGIDANAINRDLAIRGYGKIKAIGVLGSDVYDKLAVLQLLRKQFPTAVFFTTDMDARLYHPTELPWTRNLIVASAQGLEAHERLQGGIPPFRTTYQTSAFLATRLILNDVLRALTPAGAAPQRATLAEDKQQVGSRLVGDIDLPWANRPRLFEIGITAPFAFPLLKADDPPDVQTQTYACESDLRAGECISVQPARAPNFPTPPSLINQFWFFVASALSIGLGACAVVLLFSSRLTKKLNPGSTSRIANTPLWLAAITCPLVGAILLMIWPYAAGWLTGGGLGEPIYLMSGISAWPSIGIQLLSIALTVRFFVLAGRQLDTNVAKIQRDFHLRIVDCETKEVSSPAPKRRVTVSNFVKVLSYRIQVTKDTRLLDFWNRYVAAGRTQTRLCRLSIETVTIVLFWFVLSFSIGNPLPMVRAVWLDWVNTVLVFTEIVTASMLIFLVADATFLCVSFVSGIQEFTSVWPNETIKKYKDLYNVDGVYLDQWIDMNVVARRTSCISVLIYYPFAILALLILSHTSLFDYFPPNWPLITLGTAGLMILFVCSLALRWMAEKQRKQATISLLDHLVKIRGQAADATSQGVRGEQIEVLLRLVNDFDEGAFTPLSQQPAVRALMFPLGGLGGTALMQYLSLPGI